MNARFWIYWNDGFVKITLAPGQEIALSYGGPCEEGYSYTTEVFRHVGDRVETESHQKARDCDGPMERHWYGECRMDRLDARDADEFGPARPDWEEMHSDQRDYYAEAMNY